MFRNIRSRIPKEQKTCTLVELVDDKFREVNLSTPLPCSVDYSLKDMLASGVKIQPVDTTIIHDSSATSALAEDFINNAESDQSNNVQSSNNE